MGQRSPSLEEWRGSVSADLGHLKEKLDEGFERIEKVFAEHAALDQVVQTALTERVTKTETKQAHLTGRLVVYSLLISAALGVVMNLAIASLQPTMPPDATPPKRSSSAAERVVK